MSNLNKVSNQVKVYEGYQPNEIVADLNFLDFDLKQFSYGQPGKENKNVGGNLGFGNQIDISPEIKNSSNQDLILKFTQ
mgnify:CR=1 FL=1